MAELSPSRAQLPEESGFFDIGVMGGMFDPVHNGHLRMAIEALEGLALEELRLIPCGAPPHRGSARGDCAARLEMLRLACAGEPGLTVDARECERGGTSYTFDTLVSLKRDFPAARLFLLLGADAFNILPTWHRWEEIFNLAHLVVMNRPGWKPGREGVLGDVLHQRLARGVEELKDAPCGGLLLWEMSPVAISSSQVRELINAGKSARYLLPDTVWNYIRDNRLYSEA